MKTIYKGLIAIFLLAVLGGCQEEFDPGSTEAVQFAGEWFYQVQLNDGTVLSDYDYHGDPVLTYNTSDNLPDEIWIDDQDTWPLYMKAKAKVDGESSSFTGTGVSPNEIAIAYYGIPEAPEADGVAVTDTMDYDYAAIELLEGEILEDAAKVWQDKEQAPADSIRIRVVGHAAVFHYTSKAINFSNEDTTYTYYILERDTDFLELLFPLDTIIYSGHKQTGWEVYL